MPTSEAERLARLEAVVESLESMPRSISKIEQALVGLQVSFKELGDHVAASNGRLAAVERLVWLAVGGVGVLTFGIPIVTLIVLRLG